MPPQKISLAKSAKSATKLFLFFALFASAQQRTTQPDVGQFAATIRQQAQNLVRIGYDAFKIDVSKIPPGPVDKSYVLSPRDKVILRVWGQLQLNYNITVSDDLYLEIPDLPGRIYISGLPLAEVEDRVRRQLATVYSSYFNLDQPAASTAFVDMSLAEITDLRFLVQGEVVTPGSYSLHPSLGNIIYALARAGGVKENGSLRNIKIRRGEQLIAFDFYDFLIRGSLTLSQTQIRNNDVIFVPLKRKEVTVKGEVKRPGIYELTEAGNEDLENLLDLAGGLKPTANAQKMLILRSQISEGLKTFDVDLEESRKSGKKVLLQDQDIVTVFPVYQKRLDFVSVRGQGIAVAGEYQLKLGMRISDAIAEAGGLVREAYRERADLVRTHDDATKSYFRVDLTKLTAGDASENRQLRPLDELIIYSVAEIEGGQKFITLRGHAKFPGRYEAYRGMRLYDVLFGRGGFQDKDYLRDTYLERGDLIRTIAGTGRKELIKFHLGKLLDGDPAQNLELQSDDEIVIYSQEEILGGNRSATLTGYAKSPGKHPLLKGMRISDLLYTAAGFQDPDYRRGVFLARGDLLRPVSSGGRVEKELIRFDVGAVLDGDPRQNVELQSGDEIILYAARDMDEKRYVNIDGEVNKPGRYELAMNMTLEDLVIRGGGLKDAADPNTAELSRVDLAGNPEVRLQTLKVALSDKAFALRTNDRLVIRPRAGLRAQQVVEVKGEVLYPGRYTLTPGADKVADVVAMAGGLREGAFLGGAELWRKPDPDVIPEPSAQTDSDVKPPSKAELAPNRVVFDMERAVKDPSLGDNLALQDGDSLFIPRLSNTVTVAGEVFYPLTMAYREGRGVDYYLNAAGGTKPSANKDAVAVILPSGRTSARSMWGLGGPAIQPGSLIQVPSRYTTTTTTSTTTTTTTTTTSTTTTQPSRNQETPINIILPGGGEQTLTLPTTSTTTTTLPRGPVSTPVNATSTSVPVMVTTTTTLPPLSPSS